MSNRDFLDIPRLDNSYRPVAERLADYSEVETHPDVPDLQKQARRCMNCGIPFCHSMGCPLENQIPEINQAAAEGRWADAWKILSSTSCFPEFTSRLCPALCEGSCVNGIDLDPVTIRQIEYMVIEQAFALNLVVPRPPEVRTGKTVAVIGSGPAGMVVAELLNRAGHLVTVFEANLKAGGLMRYGIPDFKLDKGVIERRVEIMIEEGISFRFGTNVGTDVSLDYLARRFDAVVIATGTPVPRDLKVEGRESTGVYFALEYLQGRNRLNSGECVDSSISAEGKRVVVIGGGDTGSDCVGTANREHAKSVTQIEIMPQPPENRSDSTPWPMWPYQIRTSSSHKEGCVRDWNVATKRFASKDGHVTAVEAVRVEWEFTPEGRPLKFRELDEKIVLEADLVLLALGFLKPDPVASEANVFVAGDAATGQSLIVRAMASGRKTACKVNEYLESAK
ncbi:MAG: glutamate synthase subunit beta [Victivallaceae bacterium]|nr:glutamate synthase subunit beta [Victivallaceae bacterium]